MKFPLLTYCLVSVQKGSSTYVQGRWYSLLWVVSTAKPSTSTPQSEMMHCAAWPSYHLLRNWVGSSLQSGGEHSRDRRQAISVFSIMSMIPEFSVGIQMGRSVSVRFLPTGIFEIKIWNSVESFRPNFAIPFLTNRIQARIRQWNKKWKNPV